MDLMETYSEISIVEMLIGIGYSKARAENLYQKYKEWGKLERLKEYIEFKQSDLSKYDYHTLKNM